MTTFQHFAGRSLYSAAIKRWAAASVLALFVAMGATSWVALKFVDEDVAFVSAEIDGVGVLERWVPVSMERQAAALRGLASAVNKRAESPSGKATALDSAVADLQLHLSTTGDPLQFRPLLLDFLADRLAWGLDGAGPMAEWLPMSRPVFREISERSKLVLDGELQTYALMEALMLTLPQIQDDFVLLWAQAIHASAGGGLPEGARLAELQRAASGLFSRTDELRRYLLHTRGSTDLATIADVPLAELDAFETLSLLLEKTALQRVSTSGQDVELSGQAAMTHLTRMYGVLLPKLSVQLHQRAEALATSRWLVMVLMGVGVLCVVAAFLGIRRAARQHLVELGVMHSQLRIAACAFETSDGMLVLDAQGVVQQINTAFVGMTGYPPDKLLGKTLAELDESAKGQVSWLALWESARRQGFVERDVPLIAADGSERHMWLRVSTVRSESDLTMAYVAVMTDRTRQLATDQTIRRLELQDPLTQLPNRRQFLERLDKHLAGTKKRLGVSGAVLFLDVDGFQMVNDVAGHHVGDQLLRQVAERLSVKVQGHGLLARLGGDEFGVLLNTVDSPGDTVALATHMAMECLSAINERMDLDSCS